MKLTYKQLAEAIKSWSHEQQEQDVTIHIEETDEFVPLKDIKEIDEDLDVLDKGHKYLVIY